MHLGGWFHIEVAVDDPEVQRPISLVWADDVVADLHFRREPIDHASPHGDGPGLCLRPGLGQPELQRLPIDRRCAEVAQIIPPDADEAALNQIE